MIRKFNALTPETTFPDNYYRIPKDLFTAEHLEGISFEALCVYGILYDMAMQAGEVDKTGCLVVPFTQADLMELLNCGREHARTIFREVIGKNGAGLVEQRQGPGYRYMARVKDYRSFTLQME